LTEYGADPVRFSFDRGLHYKFSMNYLQIALLALIQGAAELLPVSSSAHVILASRLMGLDPSSPEMTFLIVMLHTGTMFAVIVYFWKRWRTVLAASRREPGGRLRLILMVLLATAVTGVVGLGIKFVIEKVIFIRMMGHEKGEVEELFKNLPLVATGLFLVGLLIIVAGRRKSNSETLSITPFSAMWIGLIQGLCLPFRGFSRSGATISVGLMRGINRARAEDFSFALAVVLTPPVVVRELYRLLNAKDWSTSAELGRMLLPGLVGMALSFVAGLIALRFLSAMLEKGRWKYFGYYCIALAIVVAVVAIASR
jgi:undecaprenyl-diphosphatase